MCEAIHKKIPQSGNLQDNFVSPTHPNREKENIKRCQEVRWEQPLLEVKKKDTKPQKNIAFYTASSSAWNYNVKDQLNTDLLGHNCHPLQQSSIFVYHETTTIIAFKLLCDSHFTLVAQTSRDSFSFFYADCLTLALPCMCKHAFESVCGLFSYISSIWS